MPLDISDLLTQGGMPSYVANDVETAILQNIAAAAAPTGVVMIADMPTWLAAYETTSAHAASLGDYVSSASMSTWLSNYATVSALSGYVTSSALSTALAAKEGTIAAGTTAQYWRGDKTWQTLPVAPKQQWTRAQTNTSGAYTWTFPTAFASTPVVSITVEDNTSASWNHQITAISTTSVTVQLVKTTAVTVVGVSVLGVAASPQAYVHLTAIGS